MKRLFHYELAGERAVREGLELVQSPSYLTELYGTSLWHEFISFVE